MSKLAPALPLSVIRPSASFAEGDADQLPFEFITPTLPVRETQLKMVDAMQDQPFPFPVVKLNADGSIQ